MRYAVISKGLAIEEMQQECLKAGACNLKVAPHVEEIFCDLDQTQVQKLSQVPGLAVKPLNQVTVEQYRPWEYHQPIYGASQASLASLIWEVRNIVSPPLTGEGFTIAILDTGIRKTHRGLRGKICYEANFTDSPDADDYFDHGTGVAFMAAGGRPLEGEEQGAAPGAHLLNIKVMNDEGRGTTESVVLGIDDLIRLHQQKPVGDPQRPFILNLSFGMPDDGDPDNPIRVALRSAVKLGMGAVAAAGNHGPAPGSVVSPSVDPWVVSVGAVLFSPFEIWTRSGRGPTREGLTKPDIVCFGVDILTASAKSDDAFVVQSGTSFASPYMAGGGALWAEMAIRVQGFTLHPLEVFGRLPWVSRKPLGAPLEKDNSYGYGLPFGDLIVRAIAPETANMANMTAGMSQIVGAGIMGAATIKMLQENQAE